MEITETRKAIIELIEPYMNKTLSEGCYIKWQLGIYAWWSETKLDKIKIIKSIGSFYKNEICHINSEQVKDIQEECELQDDDNFSAFYYIKEIIWHYDITAVLKYINKTNRDYKWAVCSDRIIYYNSKTDDIFDVKTKPLHLYTEQEEKELLDLLTKLK